MEILTLKVLFFLQVILHPNEATATLPPSVISQYPLQTGEPSNLLVTSTGVFATIQNYLLTFNATLSHYETFHLAREISSIAVSHDPALICLHDGSCYFRLDISYLYDEDGYGLEEVLNAAIPGAESSISSFADSFYVASSGSRGSRRSIQISKLRSNLLYSENVPLTISKKISNTNFMSRKFFQNFYDGDYIYFIALDSSATSSDSGVKLMRTCQNFNTTEEELGSMFEIKVNCSLSSHASIVSFSKSAQTIILGLSDGLGRNDFCVFSITEVNDLMTRTYEQCMDGDYSFQLPWFHLPSSCAEFEQVQLIFN